MTNEQKIQHLYARIGFGLSPQQLQQKTKLSLETVVKDLLKDAKKITPVQEPFYNFPTAEALKKMDKKDLQEKLKEVRELVPEVNLNWVRQMVADDSSSLQEKMTLFWHGHFACESKRFDHAARQINKIRQFALGNFRDLVVAISKDAAMIMYLNNQQNKKNKPNENYARELMELFTIGRGNYTEQDVKEAARAFTGWFTDRLTGEFEFNERQHDSDTKTFMGKTGNWNGDDIVDFILERRETAAFIATKFYRYFVNEKVDAVNVETLADAFYKSNYNIEILVKTMLESTWFYEAKNVGCKIKSPIELLVGMSKQLGIVFNNTSAAIFPQRALGQVLFSPPNVAGWAGGKTWIDNSTLMLRMNLAAIVFERSEMTIAFKDEPEKKAGERMKKLNISASIEPIKKAFQKTKEAELGQAICDYLLQVTFNIKGAFMEDWVAQANTPDDKLKVYVIGIMSLPEYQMC